MEHDAKPLERAAQVPAPATVPAPLTPARGAIGKHERHDMRRRNLIMLTAARGAKIALTHAANLTSSRVSLMTSGRKPVSDPFAQAIEQALGLPPGWLDVPQTRDAVPHCVWDVLGAPSGADIEASPTADRQRTLPGAGPTRNADAAAITALLSQATATPTALFDKPHATVGPIAEALARTILNLSRSDKLSERKAFQLLGALLNDDA
ncbi:MAG: hypothetical protein AzoDbin1_02433 [Azoarcus sp.]|uniref:Uncharacterized protein n=1 Tax=Aromatoleum tolulyticum TaxID=34027 RepID=A0A1N7BBU8_9RHOO|nr:hypothetical protein [Aromatoleum tolulyticum]MCK9985961.1 hypothetical protein [Azoarcus sp.]SIR48768.1 hypothetical protein SAMN05421829_11730 [Aromatoleum tolulyticum]